LSSAPHRGFVDETSGVRTDHSGAEIQLLADRELDPDGLIGAVNLLFANACLHPTEWRINPCWVAGPRLQRSSCAAC
jgi:hypothetical protein